MLRLTTGLRAGFDLVSMGTLLLLALIVVLAVGNYIEALWVFSIFAIPSGLLGSWAFLAGIRRLALTLKESSRTIETRLPPTRPTYPDDLPPSVIEGTTKNLTY